MSHRTWNDLTPRLEPLIEHGPQALSVMAVGRVLGDMRPHVMLRVGEETDSQLMRLTPAEARKIAISLLQAAERVDEIPAQPVRSN
jgi:hypothetical protein